MQIAFIGSSSKFTNWKKRENANVRNCTKNRDLARKAEEYYTPFAPIFNWVGNNLKVDFRYVCQTRAKKINNSTNIVWAFMAKYKTPLIDADICVISHASVFKSREKISSIEFLSVQHPLQGLCETNAGKFVCQSKGSVSPNSNSFVTNEILRPRTPYVSTLTTIVVDTPDCCYRCGDYQSGARNEPRLLCLVVMAIT